MRITHINRKITALSCMLYLSSLFAGTPPWVFTPLTTTTISGNDFSGGTATVKYRVTNQTNRTQALAMTPITGITQDISAGNCSNPFVLGPQQSCTLNLTITTAALASDITSGPEVCLNGGLYMCYSPNPGDHLNITKQRLTTSIDELALSVTGFQEHGITETSSAGVTTTVSSGVARSITITNQDAQSLLNLTISYPDFPTGTTASTTCSNSLAAKESCTITITPGAHATSSCSTAGIAPTPGTITVSANHSNTASIDILILGHRCIYQGGYLYAFDDSTATSSSIGGKVASLVNQSSPISTSSGIVWSSNSSGTYDGGVSLYGISDTSTSLLPDPSSGAVTGQTACNGATDGACNTSNIIAYYSAISSPVDSSYYAAGLCQQTIDGYSDWYLPAICELGFDRTSNGSGCGSFTQPTIQNMQASLIDFSDSKLFTGYYWSSTQNTSSPLSSAWGQYLGYLTSFQYDFLGGKYLQLGIRCSRALTA